VRNSKLLEKSDENLKAAELMADQEMYNAATSRAYYSLYQKVLHILEDHPFLEIAEKGESKSGPHEINISRVELVLQVGEDRKVATTLRYFKDIRQSCDYGSDFLINSKHYQKQIKKMLLKTSSILETYCNQQKG